MNMHAIDINSRPIIRQYDPDYLAMRDARDEAQAQATEDYIDMWAEDDLVPDAIDSALQALIDEDSGVLQQFLADYRHGDASELDQRSGELARGAARKGAGVMGRSGKHRRQQHGRAIAKAAYKLRGDGLTNQQISEQLGIDEKTVPKRVLLGERLIDADI